MRGSPGTTRFAYFTVTAWSSGEYSDVLAMNSASTVLPSPVSEYVLGQYQLSPISLLRLGVISRPPYFFWSRKSSRDSTWMMMTFLPR